ncbi:MAG TPA: hypothetical protein VFV34_12530, partial [Blastocatellia bacterium]|nr:hypothetical protein [Blastocatellia bacterium]
MTPAWGLVMILMLALGGIGLWRIAFVSESQIAEGRSALKSAFQESPVGTRIAYFNWPPPSASRGAVDDPRQLADRLLLYKAQSALYGASANQPGSESDYALGQLSLVEGRVDEAIKYLEQAVTGDPSNAKLRNDLGAALLEKAKAERVGDSRRALEYFARSLEHLNRARELDANLAEAIFNRAMCYQSMELPTEAENDWRDYLNRDSSSGWAEVARGNLKLLEQQKQDRRVRTNEEMLDEFIKAYRAGDAAASEKVVRANREIIRGRLVWWQLLEDFFRLNDDGRLDESAERLAALKYVGEIESTGVAARDPFTLELARFYESASEAAVRLKDLGRAHASVNEGNTLYLNTKYDAAIDAYTSARSLFENAGDRWEACLTDFLIASCYVRNTEPKKSLAVVEPVVGDCRLRNHLWLLSQALLVVAWSDDSLGQPSNALRHTSEAADISEQLGDLYTAQKARAQLGTAYLKLGDYRQSLACFDRCLVTMRSSWPGVSQTWRTYDALTESLIYQRLYTAAGSYGRAALRLVIEDTGDKKGSQNAFVSYMHLADISEKQGKLEEGITLALMGVEEASAMAEPKSRLVHLTYALLEVADLRRQQGEYGEALSLYNKALEPLRAKDTPALLYDACKRRLLCENAVGDNGAVQADLQTTVRLLEDYRGKIADEKD